MTCRVLCHSEELMVFCVCGAVPSPHQAGHDDVSDGDCAETGPCFRSKKGQPSEDPFLEEGVEEKVGRSQKLEQKNSSVTLRETSLRLVLKPDWAPTPKWGFASSFSSPGPTSTNEKLPKHHGGQSFPLHVEGNTGLNQTTKPHIFFEVTSLLFRHSSSKRSSSSTGSARGPASSACRGTWGLDP